MTLHWGIAILEGVFIGDTVTLLGILHWDTLLSLVMVFFEMMAYFETWLLQRLCMHWGMTLTLFWGHILRHSCLIGDGLWFILEHSYLRWFILGHSRDGEHFSLEHSHPIWILYTGAYPSFGERSDWFFTLERLPSDMVIIILFHVVLIAYWGIATLLEVLTLRLDFLFVIAAYDGLWSYRHLGFSLLGILGWSRISPYLSFHTQTFHPWYFHTFYLTRAWSSPSFILHIPPWHMTSPFSRLGEDVDQSSFSLIVLSYIFWTLGSTSSMMVGPDRLPIY